MSSTDTLETQLANLKRASKPFYDADVQSSLRWIYYPLHSVPILVAFIVSSENLTFGDAITVTLGTIAYLYIATRLIVTMLSDVFKRLFSTSQVDTVCNEISLTLKLVKPYHDPSLVEKQAMSLNKQMKYPNLDSLIQLIYEVANLLESAIKEEQVRKILTTSNTVENAP